MEFAAQRAQDWTQSPYDEDTQNAARDLLNEGGETLVEAFYTDLEFGTGGLRGLMGVGTNRMNAYTVAQATQGLANFMLEAVPSGASIAIAYDSRNNSPAFARVAAEVMAGNGIEVHLFPALRPTPQLSFTVRELGAQRALSSPPATTQRNTTGTKFIGAMAVKSFLRMTKASLNGFVLSPDLPRSSGAGMRHRKPAFTYWMTKRTKRTGRRSWICD